MPVKVSIKRPLVAGIVVCIDSKDRFLLLRRSNADERVGQWTIPGGKVDKSDASYIAGAQRELREETGLSTRPSDLQYIGMPKPEKYYYLALEWEGEVKIDIPNPKTGVIEHDSYKWATIKEIKGLDNTEIPIYLLEEALEIFKEYKK